MKKKTERLNIKLMQKDKQALKRLADNEGESMAVIVRKLIREAANELGPNIETRRAKEPAHVA